MRVGQLSIRAGAMVERSMSARDCVANTTATFFLRKVFSHSRMRAANSALRSHLNRACDGRAETQARVERLAVALTEALNELRAAEQFACAVAEADAAAGHGASAAQATRRARSIALVIAKAGGQS